MRIILVLNKVDPISFIIYLKHSMSSNKRIDQIVKK